MVNFKGIMLTVSNPVRVSPTLKIAIKKFDMYKHFGTYSSTKVCTISIECIALVGWAKLISLSSIFVNH